jgi:DNA invertase Pin-like site-specific DNA recombinase
MEEQKKDIIRFVEDQKRKGQTITATLRQIKIKRSTYYSWFKPVKDKETRPRVLLVSQGCNRQNREW